MATHNVSALRNAVLAFEGGTIAEGVHGETPRDSSAIAPRRNPATRDDLDSGRIELCVYEVPVCVDTGLVTGILDNGI